MSYQGLIQEANLEYGAKFPGKEHIEVPVLPDNPSEREQLRYENAKLRLRLQEMTAIVTAAQFSSTVTEQAMKSGALLGELYGVNVYEARKEAR